MEALIQQLKSPSFWYLSVVVGLILNVAASYLRQLLDKGVSSGSSWLRGFSNRTREKRAARAQQISAWIEMHEFGAILALSDGNFRSLAGLVSLTIALVGCVAALAFQFGNAPILTQLPLVLLLVVLALVGMALLSSGAQIRLAVAKHRKGLVGLYPRK